MASAEPVTSVTVLPSLSATATLSDPMIENADVLLPPVLLITTLTVAVPVTVNSYPPVSFLSISVDETSPDLLVLFRTVPNTVT